MTNSDFIKQLELYSDIDYISIRTLINTIKIQEKGNKAGIPEIEVDPLTISLNTIKFHVSLGYALNRSEIKTLGDVIKYSRKDLMLLPYFGTKTLNLLEKLLYKYNLKLKP